MKFSTVAITVAAAGTLAAAQPHRHHHGHHHVKRAAEAEVDYVPGPTVYEYEFEGETISEKEVCEGIQDGTMEWADDNPPPSACKPQSDEDSEPELKDAQFFEKPADLNQMNADAIIEEPTSTTQPPAYTPTPEPEPTYPTTPDGDGVDSDFPDGELSCSEFPSSYGAVAAEWLGLGGWTGVQHVTISGNMVSDIRTALTGETCADGAMCSYACPAGYQKSQWPSTQGSTGQSVGGLECRGGKLYLTNSSYSKKLCIPGTGNVMVKNTLSEGVAVCRTDYPGTEAETVALDATPGSENPLTCPDANTYYQWQGKPTTAQYYLNPKGVPIEEGCQWGDPSGNVGNYAPLNLGAGQTDGVTWLSLLQNAPTTYAKLNYNVRITGDLGGACKYEDGMFHDLNGANSDGCTVQLNSGTATYEFY
ncbi:Secreted beta-glucosidase sun1 [Arachnomyces sp. PD_36]|nr:Secreted beta-glucosidase sun1 [Arachnomyces sp. PD_36]